MSSPPSVSVAIMLLIIIGYSFKTSSCLNVPIKAGFYLRAFLRSLNVAFVPRSRFKQRQIPPLRTFNNALRFCVNFWVILRHFGKKKLRKI